VIATTGGTGLAERDLTPRRRATSSNARRPGWRKRCVRPTPRAPHRGKAGTLGAALILNLPGSPAGAAEHLAAVIDVLPHAVACLPARPRTTEPREDLAVSPRDGRDDRHLVMAGDGPLPFRRLAVHQMRHWPSSSAKSAPKRSHAQARTSPTVSPGALARRFRRRCGRPEQPQPRHQPPIIDIERLGRKNRDR